MDFDVIHATYLEWIEGNLQLLKSLYMCIWRVPAAMFCLPIYGYTIYMRCYHYSNPHGIYFNHSKVI